MVLDVSEQLVGVNTELPGTVFFVNKTVLKVSHVFDALKQFLSIAVVFVKHVDKR